MGFFWWSHHEGHDQEHGYFAKETEGDHFISSGPVADLEQGAKNYHGGKETEQKIEDYVSSFGFKEKHNGLV